MKHSSLLCLLLLCGSGHAETLPVCEPDSLLTIRVGKTGGMARFAHEHLVASRDLGGEVRLAEDFSRSTAKLGFRFDELSIDDARLREAAGMEGQPSARAIRGTRRNMLEKVIDSRRNPRIDLEVSSLQPLANQPDEYLLVASIHFAGRAHSLQIPAAIERQPGEVRVRGEFRILQSDLGIQPFTAMLGSIKVADELRIRFQIRAAEDCRAAPRNPAREAVSSLSGAVNSFS